MFLIKKNPEAVKQEKIASLWNYMTSMNKKDKQLLNQLMEQDNAPLEYKDGEVPKSQFLKNKKIIEKSIIQKQIDSRVYDFICFKIKDDVYELLDESYDQFYAIIGG